MEEQRRGRLDKGFPLIKPRTSQWGILDVLQGCHAQEIRSVASSRGLQGEYDLLLAAPLPSPSSPQKNEALGLFYVGESARRYGFNVAYWDARHEMEDALWDKIARANVVGFTAITGYQLLEFVRLAEGVKRRHPEKPIILGGAHATLTPPHMNVSDPLVDFVVMGEGELRLPALLRAHYSADGMKLVDGIGYRTKDGETVVNPSLHVPDPVKGHMVAAVSPHTLPYFLSAAARNEMILPTSRGCPWSPDSCDFCSVGKQYLDSYRAFPFELWKQDILAVHKHVPIRHIELEDENSAAAIKPQQPYLPFLKSIGATSHLHLRSDQLRDEERVRWLAEVGVMRIHIGVESGNDRVLNQVMHKNECVEDHYVAARNLAKHSIEMVGTYIVANPTETWEEISDTLRVAEELQAVFPKGMYRATVYVLAALPGTPIFDNIERMHRFRQVLDSVEAAVRNGGLGEEALRTLAGWYRLPTRPADLEAVHPRLRALANGNGHQHKVADTARKALADFLTQPTARAFDVLKSETEGWLWPMAKTLREWTQVSAAYNPSLPKEWNAIYAIGGIHFNKHHKTAQNFPGWKRALIKPFEVICDLRYHYRYFKYADLELKLMSRLINWAAQRSVGSGLSELHRRKAFENYSSTLAGH